MDALQFIGNGGKSETKNVRGFRGVRVEKFAESKPAARGKRAATARAGNNENSDIQCHSPSPVKKAAPKKVAAPPPARRSSRLRK